VRVLIQVCGTNEFRYATAGVAFDVMTDGCARSRVVAACLVRPDNWEKAGYEFQTLGTVCASGTVGSYGRCRQSR